VATTAREHPALDVVRLVAFDDATLRSYRDLLGHLD
jgi:hypothetical protein